MVDDSASQQHFARSPSYWVTGEEPMTGPQRSHLHTLAREAGIEVPSRLTRAAAAELIDELQEHTGREA